MQMGTDVLIHPSKPCLPRPANCPRDILIWRRDHLYYSTNLMVISKDLSDNAHYFTSLLKFRDYGNNILLAQPEGKGNLRFLASSVWLWFILSTGGSPLKIISGCVEAIPPNIQSGSVQVVTPSPTCSSSSSGRSLRPTNKKQKKRGLKHCQKKRKISSNTKFEN